MGVVSCLPIDRAEEPACEQRRVEPVVSMLINGREAEQLSVLDRGFQYGDGLFETLRVANGRIRHWSRHLARLTEGCERLAIATPDADVLQAEALQLCADA